MLKTGIKNYTLLGIMYTLLEVIGWGMKTKKDIWICTGIMYQG